MSEDMPPKPTGQTSFFTLSLQDRGSDLLIKRVDSLRCAVRQVQRAMPFFIDAWVVLPDHLHAIWTTPAQDGANVRLDTIKRLFAQDVAGSSPIWAEVIEQRVIKDRADYRSLMSYCWADPVRHQMVARPEAWLHSSIHRDRHLYEMFLRQSQPALAEYVPRKVG
jgi:putative transposase